MFRYSIVCSLDEPPRGSQTLLFGEPEKLAHDLTMIGANGVELQLFDPMRFDPIDVRHAFSRELIAVSLINTDLEYSKNGLCLIEQNYIKRREHIEKFKELIDFAAMLGCPVNIGAIRGMLPIDLDDYEIDSAVERFTESVYDICDHAKSRGVKVYLEALLRYISNYLNTSNETIAYASSLKIGNLGVCLDTRSMLMEDGNFSRSLFLAASKMDYIRFCESNGLGMGHGNVDFRSVMSALLDGGYDGFISIAASPYPSGLECAKNSLNYLRALETSIRSI